MADPFDSPKFLVQWAAHHLHKFNATEESFIASVPAAKVVEKNEGEEFFTHKIRLLAQISPAPALLAFDILNALRSALDHAMYASVVALTGKEPTNSKFPFGDTEEKALTDVGRKGKNPCDPNIIQRALKFKPWRDNGNEPLWAINALRNIKNHQNLIDVQLYPSETIISDGYVKGFIWTTPYYDSEKRELIYMRTWERDHSTNINCGVCFVFGAKSKLPGRSCRSIFDDMVRVTQEIVLGLEAETARLREGQRVSDPDGSEQDIGFGEQN